MFACHALIPTLASLAVTSVKALGTRDENSKRVTPPSKEKLQQIATAADYIPRVRIVFASTTGLRASEQWASTWSGMNIYNGEVRVRQRIDSYGEIRPPKSAAGVRDVPVSDYVLQLKREWKLASTFSGDDEFVFPNKRGGTLGHDNFVKRVYKPLLRNVQVNVGWHALRHFAISTSIEQGAQPKQSQTWAGHASLETTMSRYGHLSKSDTHKELMNKVSNELFNGE